MAPSRDSLSECQSSKARRLNEMGRRPVKIASCSGYACDPSDQMLLQATGGDIDFITGDYLAEMNLAENAEVFRAGTHPGYVQTAWEGLEESIDILAEKGIKVVINGGSINPSGLALRVRKLIRDRNLDLKVAFVSGDDLIPSLGNDLAALKTKLPPHLDSENPDVKLPWNILDPTKSESIPVIAANAYLGARAIVQGLRLGADIIICGRVADASPVIGAAWYWHSWTDTDYDQLAGALIAGHLIECTAYVTGGNFSGFTEHDQDIFLEPGFPIAEIESNGSCTITKHEGTGGMVTEDTVTCQFLYELQGNVYLNSDVKAFLNDVTIKSIGKNRVHVSGIKGAPPPPTTKATIFYRGGFQSQVLINATGYGTSQKWALLERQLRKRLAESGADNELSILEFQVVGTPESNPRSQLRSTTYMRMFAEAATEPPLIKLLMTLQDISLQHFSGWHSSLDNRTAPPKPFLAMYPALFPQDSLREMVTFCEETGSLSKPVDASHPPKYEPLERRDNLIETLNGVPISEFGATKLTPLGDLVLARSGDKGSNLNVGFFVRSARAWEWLRSFLSSRKMMELMGEDWSDDYFLERVEFPNIFAVHFVVYGILGRGVSSSTRLDALGKAFADYIRDKVVDVPVEIL